MQRLQFIEFRLLWEGHVNRSDLIQTFGISVPQSTLDFREYMERAPGNMDYDKRLRHYFPTPTFKPIFISDRAEGYLSQLTALAISGENQSIPGLIGATPSFDILPAPERRVDSSALRQLLKSMREGLSVEIYYQSLSSPNPNWRRIAPHSLASDGMRWHVRAYCYAKKEFRDFVLGRIMDIRDEQVSAISATADMEWNEFIKVTIAPNPALTAEQHKIIERDYSMMQGRTDIRLRKSLLFYLKRRLGLDDDAEKSPAAQQVIIVKIKPAS
ncbi:WYL domain-containing protein [Methylobacillus sp. Pita2]|uniref:WYL domain-containing protein n=1 Tax=Methylobacillus sp. Pita2 TaxID=3383245 RepID=UPI0038B5E126